MQRQAKAEEKAQKKKAEEQIKIEVKPPPESDDMVPFAGLAEEEPEEDVPEAFDNTLENLMTIEETAGNADVSMVTDNAAQGGEGGGEKGPKEERET